ncbi:MAG: hypothetical protein K2Y13_01405 [Burkholderiaceae bacterium]|nr:hypothetical protein [Burkholderiaceae bacterium]
MATAKRKKPSKPAKAPIPLTRRQKVEVWLCQCKAYFLFSFKKAVLWAKGTALRFRWLARALGAIILGAPPYIVGQYYQVSPFAVEVRKNWPLISQALDNYVFFAILLAGTWVFLLLGLYNMVLNFVREQPDGWSNAPAILLRSLDNIVGSKEQRFSRYLSHISTGSMKSDPAQVFSYITQPSQQLNEIILSMYLAMDSLLKEMLPSTKYVLKANLSTIDPEQNIKNIHFHYPSNLPVRSSMTHLNNPSSAIRTAVRNKRIVIIESIQMENVKPRSRFVVTDEARRSEDGSLICYPVIYDPLNMVVFVISIYVDHPGTFKQKFAASYEEFLKPFALRIKLEYSLLALKEMTSNGNT